MLFDHSSDPLELNNLSGKEAYQQTMEKLHTKMTDNWGEDFFVDRKVVQED
jgi:hypothetical protein